MMNNIFGEFGLRLFVGVVFLIVGIESSNNNVVGKFEVECIFFF